MRKPWLMPWCCGFSMFEVYMFHIRSVSAYFKRLSCVLVFGYRLNGSSNT